MIDESMNEVALISCTHKVCVSGIQPAQLVAETCGEGPDFVWSHALLASMRQDLEGGVLAWRKLAADHRIIRYDARGHGQSDPAGEPEDFSWPQQAGSLWELVDHFTDEPVVLGGASMGSGITLHAACQRPERVRGMVLVIPPRAWKWREGKAGGYRVTANVLRFGWGLPLRLLGRIPFSGSENFRENVRGVMARDLSTFDYRGVMGAMRGAALSDFPDREQLAGLDIPALILAWPDDDTHPLAVAEELDSVLPDSTLEVAGTGRGPYDWPERVREFLSKLA